MAFGERFVSNITWIANKALLNTLLWVGFSLRFPLRVRISFNEEHWKIVKTKSEVLFCSQSLHSLWCALFLFFKVLWIRFLPLVLFHQPWLTSRIVSSSNRESLCSSLADYCVQDSSFSWIKDLGILKLALASPLSCNVSFSAFSQKWTRV